MTTSDEGEEQVLEFLDSILQRKSVCDFLDAVVARVEQRLQADPAAVMAWEPVPLDVYATPLPSGPGVRHVTPFGGDDGQLLAPGRRRFGGRQ